MGSAGKTFLDEIVAVRRRQVEEARARVPLSRLQPLAEARAERRDFVGAISGDSLRIIAELKRASPTRGLLRYRYRRKEIAQGYEAAGAAALSVLTEEQRFLGSLRDLPGVREAVRLPVLRKDFIIDSYQVFESAAAGADALLLIVAALSDGQLRGLTGLCQELRMAPFVEVHTAEELDRALAADARIIGVNNRDLRTLKTDLQTSFRLRERIPPGCVAVSESGIKTPENLLCLAQAGFNAVLLGEQLLTASDPGRELARLLGQTHELKSRAY